MNSEHNSPIANLITDLDADTKQLSTQCIREELRTYGINPDTALVGVKSVIARHLKLHRTSWMQEAEAKKVAMERNTSTVQSFVGRTREEIRSAYEQLMHSLSPKDALAFRNRGELSDEDKARILDDFQKLNGPNP